MVKHGIPVLDELQGLKIVVPKFQLSKTVKNSKLVVNVYYRWTPIINVYYKAISEEPEMKNKLTCQTYFNAG